MTKDSVLPDLTSLLERYNRRGIAIGPETNIDADLDVDSLAWCEIDADLEEEYKQTMY